MLGSSSQSASRYRIIPGWPETLVLSSKMWRTSMKFISISRAVRTRAILPSYWSGHQARGKIHGVRHHHRPRDSRSAPDREQDVLVVRYRVRAAAEYPDGSGFAGPARHAAGHDDRLASEAAGSGIMGQDDKFRSLSASATELSDAWKDRLEDANVLFSSGRNASAISSGLYAIEILLKTRGCVILRLSQMPRILEIHDLVGLATFAGLRQIIDDPQFKDSKTGQDWTKVLALARDLSKLRYSPDSNWTKQDTMDFLDCLQDPDHGVISWIQKLP